MADETDSVQSLPTRHRQLLAMLGDTTIVLALLTLGYFTFPLRLEAGEVTSFVRLGASVVLFGTVGWLLVVHSRRSRRRQAPDFFRIQQLLAALYLLVLTFALAYAVTGAWSPDEIAGVTGRVDALYFSVTVISTVGFGDIHASGSFGRMLVTVQMLFNLIYIGTSLRILSSFRGATQPPAAT